MMIQALQAAIDRNREVLLALPDAVGIGIGLAHKPDGAVETQIRVFVRTPEATAATATAAKRILNDLPFEVVVEGTITAFN